MKYLYQLFAAVAVWTLPVVVWAEDNRILANPLTNKAEALGISSLVGRAVQIILGASGVVAAIVIVIAGMRIIFSQGSEDSIAQGKRAILWAVLGIVIAFGGYMVVGLILESTGQFLK